MASQTYNHPTLPAHQQQQQYPPQPYGNYTHPSLPQRQESPQRPQLAQQHSRQESSQYKSQNHGPERTRPKSRGFSFHSSKSSKAEKLDIGSSARRVTTSNLHETSAEKESKRLHTKADPTVAMQEAEPGVEARTKGRSMPYMRDIEWKEPDGKPVEYPDRSNPSRSKYERPLETIRKLEAAIDGGYSVRQSIHRADSDSVANFNRRSGYYGSGSGWRDASTPRFPQDSYYGGRPMSTSRPDSVMFDPRSSAMLNGPGGNPRDSYFDGYESAAYGYGGGSSSGRNRYSRTQTNPHMPGRPAADRNVYPVANNHRSYETVASGSGGSASVGEPAGYQTDPTSSENSSIDRRMPARRQEPVNDYGISFGQSPSYQPPSLGVPASQPRTMPNESVPVAAPMPAKQSGGGGLLRKSSSKVAGGAPQRPEAGDKRKSWFSRRFSKNS